MLTTGSSGSIIRAAAYARMSTDRQNYSIQQQLDHIHRYAAAHSMQLVRTFVDEGRSGLDLEGRAGLKSLLAEVEGGTAPFTIVLVYDVTRWGRFQDVDESAHYEFICRRAGVLVSYCAEQFVNDGSPLAAMIKGIKRAMAAEYSRELSAKVFSAQCKFAALGFKQGGAAGYALRRVSVSESGEVKRVLEPGERKGLLTDRVIYAVGTDEEVAVVRRIYRLYLDDGYGDTEIAAALNRDGIFTELNKPWDPYSVKRVLVHPKYCGAVAFNRSRSKLRTRSKANSPDKWIIRSSAFEPIVPPATFKAAQQERLRRMSAPNSDHVLPLIFALYQRHGDVSTKLIKQDRALPGPAKIASMFGSLGEAYALAGVPMTKTVQGALTKRGVRVILNQFKDAVTVAVNRAGGLLRPLGHGAVFMVNESVRVRLVVSCCRHEPAGVKRWKVPVHLRAPVDFVLCAQLDLENSKIDRYLLLATSDHVAKSMWLRDCAAFPSTVRPFPILEEIFGLSQPSKLP